MMTTDGNVIIQYITKCQMYWVHNLKIKKSYQWIVLLYFSIISLQNIDWLSLSDQDYPGAPQFASTMMLLKLEKVVYINNSVLNLAVLDQH